MSRPEQCPNCGNTTYKLKPPDAGYAALCWIGTEKPEFGGWEFYHE